MRKSDLNKQKKREALLNTAFELFTTQGITRTTINNIVEAAGVAKGTFYLYFKDKYEIEKEDKQLQKHTVDGDIFRLILIHRY